MKLTIGGKWEIDLVPSDISKELEEELKRTVRLTSEIDRKVEDVPQKHKPERKL